MSGVTTATAIAAIGAAATVAGAVGTYAQGQKQAGAEKDAQKASKSAADKLYAQQDQANNAANARGPNTDAIRAENQVEGQAGQSGTMLTGPMGVDPNDLSLGKNTLLGGAAQ